MADIFDGYSVRELDDIRRAVKAVQQAIDSSAQDQHAGAGTLLDAVERIHGHLSGLGQERAVKGLAALVYGMATNPSTTMMSWNNSAADVMVELLKQDGTLGDE